MLLVLSVKLGTLRTARTGDGGDGRVQRSPARRRTCSERLQLRNVGHGDSGRECLLCPCLLTQTKPWRTSFAASSKQLVKHTVRTKLLPRRARKRRPAVTDLRRHLHPQHKRHRRCPLRPARIHLHLALWDARPCSTRVRGAAGRVCGRRFWAVPRWTALAWLGVCISGACSPFRRSLGSLLRLCRRRRCPPRSLAGRGSGGGVGVGGRTLDLWCRLRAFP
jgi:hypothetical protein